MNTRFALRINRRTGQLQAVPESARSGSGALPSRRHRLVLALLSLGTPAALACTAATPANLTVTTTANSGDGSLACAINEANAQPSSTITINLPVNSTITLTAALPALTTGVTINTNQAVTLHADSGNTLFNLSAASTPVTLGAGITLHGGAGTDGAAGAPSSSGNSGTNGGDGAYGSGFTLTNAGTLNGGNGGNAGAGGNGNYAGIGGTGGNGGRGLAGLSLTLTNTGTIRGGAGGSAAAGGNGTYAGIGGTGGSGGTGIQADTSTITNSGSIFGGAGAPGSNGGTGTYSASGGGGGTGGNAIDGSNFTLTNSGTLTGGQGGGGGAGGSGSNAGGAGSGITGGTGLSGTNFTATNAGTITGGAGGNGGTGGTETVGLFGGAGGDGGNGGAAVSGSGFTLSNTLTIRGGNGGNGGSGGNAPTGSGSYGGSGGNGGSGGAGVTGSDFTLNNASGSSIRGGDGGTPGTPGSGDIAGQAGTVGNGGFAIVASGNSIIRNAGTIAGGLANGGSGSRADAVHFSGDGNKLVIQAGSVIQGNVVSSSNAGSDTLALGGTVDGVGGNSFALGQIGTQFIGFTTFAKEDASQWSLTGTGGNAGDTWTVSAGTLRLDTGAALTGNVSISNGATLTSGNASLTGNLGNSGTLSIGSSASPAATLNVTGNYTQAASGTLQIAAAGTGSHGKLAVSGTATLPAAAKLHVDVSNVNTLANGQTLSQVIQAGTLNASTFAITDNSAVFDFTSALAGNQLNLNVVTSSSAPILSATTTSGVSSAAGAARVLDSLLASGGTGDMANVVSALGRLPTNAQAAAAAAQTLPLVSGGLAQLNAGLFGTLGQLFGERSVSGLGRASGDTTTLDQNAWGRMFGSRTTQDDRDGTAGFNANIWGLALGADTELAPGTRAGLALSYARINVDGNSGLSGTAQHAEVHAVTLSTYGSRALSDDSALKLRMDIGQNLTQGERNIAFGGLVRTAKSDYRSNTAHVGIEVDRHFLLTPALRLSPLVRADYTWIRDPGYSESGAGALNLEVGANTSRALVLGGGARLRYALDSRRSLVADFVAGYDTINQRANLTAAYAGAPGQAFVTEGLRHSPWMLQGGLGYVAAASERLEVAARYDIQGRAGYTNQSASLRMRWAF